MKGISGETGRSVGREMSLIDLLIAPSEFVSSLAESGEQRFSFSCNRSLKFNSLVALRAFTSVLLLIAFLTLSLLFLFVDFFSLFLFIIVRPSSAAKFRYEQAGLMEGVALGVIVGLTFV